ncbi:hypothetical protein QNO08_01395 [Arthrobacter sp. zg-Y820]|uniref:hypothetical protein n=1 Tax=unclassified Arthrobacter TaxID=235627 RepID=UPI001E4B4D9D|nr:MULTISPECIES: hypothetical protein [unclassified Arthrobacter]MCC9198305.1 hypothetical protein [Arthrobacter sp. zg-Y820]MDK1281175.1 hypothetical protein [Arthrobacter sp. zg.Y820]WIB09767.1 hypothetical protein QNO08_01395 [Arthrobacter sp. zg-Y820]
MTDSADDVAPPPLLAPTDAPHPEPRVFPGPLAAALGYVVACLVLASIATAAVGWGTARDFWGYVWTVVVAAFYAAGLGLFTALPVAVVLAWSLRRVLNQGLHILAFFFVPTVLAWLIIGLSVHAVLVPLLMGAALGLSMAAGRAAIWRFSRARP